MSEMHQSDAYALRPYVQVSTECQCCSLPVHETTVIPLAALLPRRLHTLALRLVRRPGGGRARTAAVARHQAAGAGAQPRLRIGREAASDMLGSRGALALSPSQPHTRRRLLGAVRPVS